MAKPKTTRPENSSMLFAFWYHFDGLLDSKATWEIFTQVIISYALCYKKYGNLQKKIVMLAKEFRVWQNRSVLIAFPSIIVAGVSVRCQYRQVMNLTNPLSDLKALQPNYLNHAALLRLTFQMKNVEYNLLMAPKLRKLLTSMYKLSVCLFVFQTISFCKWCLM